MTNLKDVFGLREECGEPILLKGGKLNLDKVMQSIREKLENSALDEKQFRSYVLVFEGLNEDGNPENAYKFTLYSTKPKDRVIYA